MVLADDPPSISTPISSPRATLPDASVPIKSPATRLSAAFWITTPLLKSPEITSRAPAVVPPIVLFFVVWVVPDSRSTHRRRCPGCQHR